MPPRIRAAKTTQLCDGMLRRANALPCYHSGRSYRGGRYLKSRHIVKRSVVNSGSQCWLSVVSPPCIKCAKQHLSYVTLGNSVDRYIISPCDNYFPHDRTGRFSGVSFVCGLLNQRSSSRGRCYLSRQAEMEGISRQVDEIGSFTSGIAVLMPSWKPSAGTRMPCPRWHSERTVLLFSRLLMIDV